MKGSAENAGSFILPGKDNNEEKDRMYSIAVSRFCRHDLGRPNSGYSA